MALTFTSWTACNDPSNPVLDWSSAAAIEGRLAGRYLEAIAQALRERCAVTGVTFPAILGPSLPTEPEATESSESSSSTSSPTSTYGVDVMKRQPLLFEAWMDAARVTLTALMPRFIDHRDSGGDWDTDDFTPRPNSVAPPWTEADLLTAVGGTRIETNQLLSEWAKQQYDILNLLRWVEPASVWQSFFPDREILLDAPMRRTTAESHTTQTKTWTIPSGESSTPYSVFTWQEVHVDLWPTAQYQSTALSAGIGAGLRRTANRSDSGQVKTGTINKSVVVNELRTSLQPDLDGYAHITNYADIGSQSSSSDFAGESVLFSGSWPHGLIPGQWTKFSLGLADAAGSWTWTLLPDETSQSDPGAEDTTGYIANLIMSVIEKYNVPTGFIFQA